MSVSLSLESSLNEETDLFKAIVFLKVTDGEWYQTETERCVRRGDVITATASFTEDNWQPAGHERPWGPWCLRRVHAVGARLYSLDPDLKEVQLDT